MKELLRVNIKLIISGGLALGLAVTIMQGFITNKYIKELSGNITKMKRHYEVVQEIGSLNRNLLLMESYSEGYIISENKDFLKDFEEREAEVKIQTNLLKQLTGYSVLDEQEYNKLNQLIEDKVSFINMVINLNDKQGAKAAMDMIKEGKGARIMDKILLYSDNITGESKNAVAVFRNSESFYVEKVNMSRVYATLTGILIIIITSFSLFQDINNRNRFESELKAEKLKAEKSALVEEQFLANMSHEIRTPMNAIVGFTRLLEKTKLDKKQTDYLGSIKKSGDGLLLIIDDILDISKMEAGMFRIEKIRFSIPSLMHSVKYMFSQKVEEKGLNLAFRVDEKIPEIVLGDPTRLTQILINLISNSVKFTDDGGIIVQSKLISEDNEGVKVKFIVKDSGIGISEGKLNTIFDRFDQGNTETTRKYGGTGLGLAIVKRLVDLQGGKVYVASTLGKGSEFSFTISYSKTNNNELAPKPREIEIQKIDTTINVLLVEDNLMNQKLAIEVLNQFGFEVTSAGNGAIAIELLKNAAFDVVLMDIQMPVLDGYRAARKIRDELKLDIPIIAMTAHVMTGEKEKCMSYGMNDYISKPFIESDLYNIICTHLPASSKVCGKVEVADGMDIEKNEKVSELSYLTEI